MNNSMLLVIISSLISGLLGVVISSLFYQKLEKKKLKIETAKKLIGNRNHITGVNFSQALNETIIVFADNKEVIQALNNLSESLRHPNKPMSNERLLSLFKAVCNDINHFPKNINDTTFLNAFNIVEEYSY